MSTTNSVVVSPSIGNVKLIGGSFSRSAWPRNQFKNQHQHPSNPSKTNSTNIRAISTKTRPSSSKYQYQFPTSQHQEYPLHMRKAGSPYEGNASSNSTKWQSRKGNTQKE
jgi:hypothetical protein